jgi:hypothetical protein
LRSGPAGADSHRPTRSQASPLVSR